MENNRISFYSFENFKEKDLVQFISNDDHGLWVRSHWDLSKSETIGIIEPNSVLIILKIFEKDAFIMGPNGIIGWVWPDNFRKI